MSFAGGESMQIEYHRTPTPHAVIPQLVAPELYARMRFPDITPRPMGRIGRDIYFGEPEWATVMKQPGWAEFSSNFMSEAFMRRLIGLFADDIRAHGCGIDPDKVYLAQRAESRAETESPVLSETDDPNCLFMRFDLQAIDATYSKKVHCDHLRRVIGGVLFLTSAEDEGLEGGEFALYSDLAFNNDRTCHQPRVEKTFPFRHNQGVVFLNSNTGFHGPTPILRMSGMRKWIYYSVSSRRNVWKAAPRRAA
jgi:hypothetical protein